MEGVHGLRGIIDVSSDDSNELDDVIDAWNGCINLRELVIDYCTVGYINAVLATAKRNLRVLKFYRWNPTKMETKEVMDLCSERCGSVEELTYCGPEPPLDAFDEFIAENDPSFSSISLSIQSDEIEGVQLFEIIEPFVRASISIELCLHVDVLEDVLKKLVGHGILVTGDFGIPRYAPW